MIWNRIAKRPCEALLVLAVLCTVCVIGVTGCDKGPDPEPAPITTDWKNLGTVRDNFGKSTIMWTVNEATGDRVYISVGSARTGIFVIPKDASRESAER